MIVLLYGVTDVFVDLAGSALVPDLVPRSRLEAANGRTLAAQQVMSAFVGGPVAGALLALGAGWVFGVPAGLGVLALLLIATRIPGSYKHAAPQRRSATAEVREGVGFLVRHPVLRPLLVAGSVMNMASTGYFAVFVLWMVGPGSRVGLEPAHYPLVIAVLAVGAVLGSIAAEPLGRRIPEVRLLLGCWTLDSPCSCWSPCSCPRCPPSRSAMFFLGFLNTNGNVISQSMRQRMVAPGMLGRVGGASRTLAYGLMPRRRAARRARRGAVGPARGVPRRDRGLRRGGRLPGRGRPPAHGGRAGAAAGARGRDRADGDRLSVGILAACPG